MTVKLQIKRLTVLSFIICLALLLIKNDLFAQPYKSGLSRFDSINIQHYDIHLDVMNFTNKIINGYTEITLNSKVNNLSKVNFDLLKMTIDSISVNGSKITTYSYNNVLLQIPLKSAINANTTIKVKVSYHGTPQQDISTPTPMGGWYFTGDYAYNLGVAIKLSPHSVGRIWHPCYDDFRSRATYDYYITTDNTHMAVCGGLLISTADNGNSTKTYHWRLTSSIPAYLSSVAVSKYVAVKDTVKGMQGTVPIMTYITKDVDSASVKSYLTYIKPVFKFFEKQFGPYRWQRVGYVGVPEQFGAMESATNIAMPNIIYSLGSMLESVYVHELSHHWFGDLVTAGSEADMWMNEGWAKFCEMYYKEYIYGKKSYKDIIRENHRDVLQNAAREDGGPYRALYNIPFDYTYGSTIYNKGSDVVHTLRNYMGDELFFSTIRQYTADNAFKTLTTDEMMKYFASKSGIKLDDFYKAWVYGPGFPHFSIDSFKIKDGNTEVYIRQRLKGATEFAKSNRIEITFMDKAWKTYTDTIIFSGEFGKKSFTVPFTPDIVMIDKEEKISDATTDNYATIKTATSYSFQKTFFTLKTTKVTDSAFVRVEHNWVGPDKMKKPMAGLTRLSSERYWKIDGIFPADFKATGIFYYSKTADAASGYLDNALLPTSTSADSLALFYRKNTADDWKAIKFTKTGKTSGNITTVDDIKPGEYCLGVGIPNVSTNDLSNIENLFSVYPNPSKGEFNIECQSAYTSLLKNSSLKIYGVNGELIEKIDLSQSQNIIKWNPNNLPEGTYIFNIISEENKIISSKKCVYLK